jgi:3-isopropylmalate/(R)-2-methylmalate dehydratase small subunit
MGNIIEGRVWKFGANIDTDVIIPARYLNSINPEELARHCMEDLDPSFSQRVQRGDIILAGENFGCGSSREHAPLAIKAVGIACVIAKSFARIFFRNAINIGLPIIECPSAVDQIEPETVIQLDLSSGLIIDTQKSQLFHATPFPSFMQDLIAAGGLMNYVMQQQRRRGDDF